MTNAMPKCLHKMAAPSNLCPEFASVALPVFVTTPSTNNEGMAIECFRVVLQSVNLS